MFESPLRIFCSFVFSCCCSFFLTYRLFNFSSLQEWGFHISSSHPLFLSCSFYLSISYLCHFRFQTSLFLSAIIDKEDAFFWQFTSLDIDRVMDIGFDKFTFYHLKSIEAYEIVPSKNNLITQNLTIIWEFLCLS